jgi:hypothetical protein
MLSASIPCYDPKKVFTKKGNRVPEAPTRWNLRRIDKHTQPYLGGEAFPRFNTITSRS